MRRPIVLLACALAPACTTARPTSAPAPANSATPLQQAAATALVGRWIFSPGDSTLPDPATDADARKPDAAKQDDGKPDAADAGARGASPAGAVLSMAEGGVMFAREGDFVRRGLWKFDGVTLRLIVEPPPRRLEMGFGPSITGDRLTLTGADGMVLVYHRDPFVAAGHAP